MKKRILVGLLAVAVSAGVVVTAQGASHTAPHAAAVAASGALVAPALVEAEGDMVSLAFDTSGRVVEVLVKEGDHVAKGDLLARLDDRLPRAAVARAEAALAAQEARRDAALRGARPDEIRAALAEATAARAQASDRERTVTRTAQLHDSGAVASAQLEGERFAADAAKAAADAADARAAVTRAGLRDESRREAIAAVVAAKADLEEARARLAQTELRASAAGTVVRRFIEPGEQVTTMPPTVALKIADLDRVRLRAEVDESDIARVTVGAKVHATAEALGKKRLAGKVVRVERELGRKNIRTDDPRALVDTRVLEAIIVLDEPSPLPLGLRVDVHIEE